jgi:hypothetical protein
VHARKDFIDADTKRERPALAFAHFTATWLKVPRIEFTEIILEALQKSMENAMCLHQVNHMERITMIDNISAVRLATHNMPRAVLSLTDPDGHELSFAWPLRCK